MWTIDRRDRVLLFSLLLLGLLLKLSWLGTNALAHDEPFTVYWALRPWAEFRAMLGSENNPPLYFILMRGWAAVVPLEPAWLRIPSAVFSALVVLPLFLLGKRMQGTVAAVVAVLLFTLNDHHYGLAHEVRAYSLFTLLTVCSVLQLHRFLNGEGRAWFWLTVFNVLLVYTHFLGWLVVGLQLLLILPFASFRPKLKAWAGMFALLLLAYLPYASIFLQRAESSIAKGTWLITPPLEEVYNMLWRWSNAPMIAVLFLGFVMGMLIKDRFRSQAMVWASIWTFVPLLGLWVVSQWIPLYLDRYLVFAAPGWALLVAFSIAQLPDRSVRAGASVAVLAMAFTFAPWAKDQHTPELVVERVEELRSTDPGAPVLVVPTWYRLTYRFAQDPQGFRSEPANLEHSNELEPGDPDRRIVILVDAAPPDAESRQLLEQLRSTHVIMDSTLASQKVWVKRFMRRD